LIKNYCQLPVSLKQKGEVGFQFFLAISQNSSVSNKLVHDRFGVKINLPKNSYVSSQYQLAKKLGWTRKKIREKKNKHPIPYSCNNNKVKKKEDVIKEHCKRQDQDVIKFTQWATKHGLNLREEFKNLAYEANHFSPNKIDLKKVLQELKEETLNPLYSIYNLLCMKGKIMEQAGKHQEAKFFKEWHRYEEGSYYARESIEQIRAAMCFYRDKIMSKVKLENEKKQKIEQEKESDIQANLTRAARKYWEELQVSDKEEAEKIIKKANILNMKTRGMLDVAKMSNLKNKKALYQFAMSCIEIELLKIDEHKQKIEKLAEMTHV
jgi:hypothetical protein